MSRFRFRAWWLGLQSFTTEIRVTADGRVFTKAGNELFPGSDIELMQSTGLTDKNGKEIFEGDIVKSGDVLETIEEVKLRWENVDAFNCWSWSFATHFMRNKDYGGEEKYERERGQDMTVDCEVIGNRFENPELLSPTNP